MTQIIFYSTAPLQVENTLFALIEKSLEKGYKSLLLFQDKEKCSVIDEKLWTYKQNSFLPHLSEDDKIFDEIDIPIYLSTKNGRILVINFKDGKIEKMLKLDNNKLQRPVYFNKSLYIAKDNSIVRLN